ncbi:hypothetical protein [Cryobacterium zhongshanensis]|uniref:Uncharacterized protein n=1 Tax=Cryobacterium zhongshanensis TaxID=2928153 RepID=A0AA41QWE5_9MICO|nr:hypothetical protein [Cryobacterium zhongshanensis]MCI4658931.1 hypothetical protein [Cryobacterium zhongshanensis]
MTNAIRATADQIRDSNSRVDNNLPTAADVNCLEPRRRDLLRIPWWVVKSARMIPPLMIAQALFLVVAAVVFALVRWGDFPFGWSIALGSVAALCLIFTLPVVFFGLVAGRWALRARDPKQRIYMDAQRRAVIVLFDDQGKNRWEAENHVVQKIGCRYGEELRNDMAAAVRSAAEAAGVQIFGKAANRTVQVIYLEQFKSWGLRKDGDTTNVIWP